VLRLQSPIPAIAIEKAEKAYEVMRPLKAAIQRFQSKANYRERWFSSLRIEGFQIPKIMDGVDLLANDLGLALTDRTFKEQHEIFAIDDSAPDQQS